MALCKIYDARVLHKWTAQLDMCEQPYVRESKAFDHIRRATSFLADRALVVWNVVGWSEWCASNSAGSGSKSQGFDIPWPVVTGSTLMSRVGRKETYAGTQPCSNFRPYYLGLLDYPIHLLSLSLVIQSPPHTHAQKSPQSIPNPIHIRCTELLRLHLLNFLP